MCDNEKIGLAVKILPVRLSDRLFVRLTFASSFRVFSCVSWLTKSGCFEDGGLDNEVNKISDAVA